MRRAAKILKIVSILFVSVLIILFAVSLVMQDKIGSLVLKTLNENFSTRIETGSYRLSLIRKFPRASVELRNVIVFSSPNFDRTGFRGINTDTLLVAKSASLEFKTTDMIRGAYTFSKITVKSGILNIYTDTSGHYNYDVSKNPEKTDGSDNVNLNLNRINFSDVRFVYNDLRVDLILKGRFRNGQAKTTLRNDKIDFVGKSQTVIEFFQLEDILLKQDIPADLDISLNKNEKGIFFRKCTMGVENWDFILTGYLSSDDYQDLEVTAKNIDISKIGILLPDKYRKVLSDYHPSGNLQFDWIIKGKPTRQQDPHYEINWSLDDARINTGRSKLKADKFSFEGTYSNGAKNRPETSSFIIKNFKTRLGSADYKGSFSYYNFSNPRIELAFSGKLLLAELKEFLNLTNITNAAGSVDMNIKFSGYPGKKNSYSFFDVFNLDSRSEIAFNSVGLTLDKQQISISDATGRIFITNKTETENFSFTINKQRVVLSASLRNFPGWLAGNPVTLSGTASVSASSLHPSLLMSSPASGKPGGNGQVRSAPLTLPENVILDLNFNIDTLSYKTFDASKITGQLSIKPKMLNFRNISLNSLNGRISGNGVIVQNRDKSFIGRGSFSVTEVDVNKSFTTFKNFGQNYLKAENIAGSLSGKLTLVLPVDSLMNPDINSITAEGKYVLKNGELINFDPVKALSKFVELSELQNIKFDRLENDFVIRNRIFFLPQMDIKSSAVDLSVNGTHSFDNKYEYHVKMLLSEILSNKKRNSKKSSDEFGMVEDDGLGRTSLLMKLEGTGEDVKVSYDMKAASNLIKDDIRKEKESLKTIFNEEYGLYNGDSALTKKQTQRKKFRIVWEGSDSTSVEKEPPVVNKESIFKKIFKKK